MLRWLKQLKLWLSSRPAAQIGRSDVFFAAIFVRGERGGLKGSLGQAFRPGPAVLSTSHQSQTEHTLSWAVLDRARTTKAKLQQTTANHASFKEITRPSELVVLAFLPGSLEAPGSYNYPFNNSKYQAS